jgi:hypothetical protein
MVTRIDRLARSVGDLQNIVRAVRARGAARGRRRMMIAPAPTAQARDTCEDVARAKPRKANRFQAGQAATAGAPTLDNAGSVNHFIFIEVNRRDA